MANFFCNLFIHLCHLEELHFANEDPRKTDMVTFRIVHLKLVFRVWCLQTLDMLNLL